MESFIIGFIAGVAAAFFIKHRGENPEPPEETPEEESE